MRSVSKESQLLNYIKENYEIIKLNNTSHDVEYIIKNMEIMEPEPPDFICDGDTYLEHFAATAYKRVLKKDGKYHLIHLSDEAKMNKRMSKPQSVFRTASYHTPPNKTNTRYLKENIDALISEKTQKQEIYDRKCPNAKKKHLLIELKSHCEILLGSKGQYLDSPESKYIIQDKDREFYEVYRDIEFIKTLKEKYSTRWDLLLFVDEFRDLEVHILYVYCFDLKENIIPNNMKNYPDALFQLIQVGLQSVHMGGELSVTNIFYDVDNDDDTLRSFLWSYDADKIVVDTVPLFKSHHDSIYITKDEGLQFEKSQRAFAINPDVDIDIMVKYVPLVLRDSLVLDCQGTTMQLKRKTFIGTFYYSDGENAFYRIDNENSLQLKLI
jgi:hypothetical protein